MASKKSEAVVTVPESRSTQQTTKVIPKKKRVAVDQYTVFALVHEFPTQAPRKGERIPQPEVLPTLVQQTAPNEFYCEVCQVRCNSYTVLQQHQAGKSHRKHVLLRAIDLKRFCLQINIQF